MLICSQYALILVLEHVDNFGVRLPPCCSRLGVNVHCLYCFRSWLVQIKVMLYYLQQPLTCDSSFMLPTCFPHSPPHSPTFINLGIPSNPRQRHVFSPQTMHFYFDIISQFLIMKKDLKLDFDLLFMYTNFLFVYPASSVGKVTSTKEVNILLKQVSINICKTLDWVVCLSDFPFIFLLSWTV